jgi:hypothetical protein
MRIRYTKDYKIPALLFNFSSTKMIFDGKPSDGLWLEMGLFQGSILSTLVYIILSII